MGGGGGVREGAKQHTGTLMDLLLVIMLGYSSYVFIPEQNEQHLDLNTQTYTNDKYLFFKTLKSDHMLRHRIQEVTRSQRS